MTETNTTTSPATRSSKRTWISILIAAVIIVGLMAVAVVGGTVFFFTRHISTQFTPSDNAAQQFAQARQRFAGQQPLIEMRKGDQPLLHREAIPKSMSPVRLDTLRVLAYDTNAGKLVRVSIPFWLLRLAPSKNFSMVNNGFDFDNMDTERMHLTVEDLERRGPGLILDQADRRGSQVLVWTE
jgi:nitrate reductase NapE component